MREELSKMKDELLKSREENKCLVADIMMLKEDEMELKVQFVEMNNDNLKLMDEKKLLKMKAGKEKWFHVTLVWGFVVTVICSSVGEWFSSNM